MNYTKHSLAFHDQVYLWPRVKKSIVPIVCTTAVVYQEREREREVSNRKLSQVPPLFSLSRSVLRQLIKMRSKCE